MKDVTPDSVEDADGPAPEHILRVCADKTSDVLEVSLYHVYSDTTYDLGIDPGLIKDASKTTSSVISPNRSTASAPVPSSSAANTPPQSAPSTSWPSTPTRARRHRDQTPRRIDGVEQLTRYCELLNRDPLLAPVHGIFAAQTITPQARVLAQDRGFECLILDYDEMKGRKMIPFASSEHA